MSTKAPLDERYPWLSRPLKTLRRFKEINGDFVASGITVTLFTSIFPLLLVAIAVVGFLASGDKGFATRAVDNLGLTGSARSTVLTAINRASTSRRTASVVGIAGLLWSGTGVGLALQRGVRAPWQEPARGMRDRVQALGWLGGAALGFAAVIALSSALNWLPDAVPKPLAWLVAIAVGLAAEVALFLWMFWGLSTRRVAARDLLPGALVAGVGFEILKLLGTTVVPRLVASSSSLYGPLGVVFAILAWLALFARLVVLASTLNAVDFEARVGARPVPIFVPDFDPQVVAANRGGTIVTVEGLATGIEVPTQALANHETPGQSDDNARERPGNADES